MHWHWSVFLLIFNESWVSVRAEFRLSLKTSPCGRKPYGHCAAEVMQNRPVAVVLGCDPVRFYKVSNTRHWRGGLFKAKPDSAGGGAGGSVIAMLPSKCWAADSLAQHDARGTVKNPVFQIHCESNSVASPSPWQYTSKNLGVVRRGEELVTDKNKRGHMLVWIREPIWVFGYSWWDSTYHV